MRFELRQYGQYDLLKTTTALSSMSCCTFCAAAMLSVGVDDEKSRLKKDIEGSRQFSWRCWKSRDVAVVGERLGSEGEIYVEIGARLDGE